jgi:hypothetical protein
LTIASSVPSATSNFGIILDNFGRINNSLPLFRPKETKNADFCPNICVIQKKAVLLQAFFRVLI